MCEIITLEREREKKRLLSLSLSPMTCGDVPFSLSSSLSYVTPDYNKSPLYLSERKEERKERKKGKTRKVPQSFSLHVHEEEKIILFMSLMMTNRSGLARSLAEYPGKTASRVFQTFYVLVVRKIGHTSLLTVTG